MNKTAELVITLQTIDKIKAFVETASKYDFDIDVISENRHYCVNAKSIMGVFSVDLSRPVFVSVPRIKYAPDIIPATDDDITVLFEKITNL